METVVITETQEPTWATITKGILLTLFGLVALAWPGLTLVTLVWLTAVYILIAGIIDTVSGVMHLGHGYWWLKLLVGIAQVAVGVYFIRHPEITLNFFLLLLGLFLLVRGFFEIILVFMPRIEGPLKWLLGLTGALSVIIGFYVLRYPLTSGVTFVWVLGLYAVIAGPILIATGVSTHNRIG